MTEPESKDSSNSISTHFPSFSRYVVTLKRQKKWLVGVFSWINLRRVVLTGSIILTALALFYTVEFIRGKRAWQSYEATLKAKKLPLSLKEFISPKIPANQNFAMSPILAPLLNIDYASSNKFRDPDGVERAKALTLNDPQIKAGRHLDFGGFEVGKHVDLSHFHTLFKESEKYALPMHSQSPAKDILFGLKKFESDLEEIRKASLRPYCRFTSLGNESDPFSIMLPHLSVMRNINSILTLRALSELSAGNSDAAHADLELMFVLNKFLQDEVFLITQLVRLDMFESALQVVWEGMVENHWTASQLQSIQEQLKSFDWLTAFENSLASERAGGNDYISMLREVDDKFGAFDMVDRLSRPEGTTPLSRRILSSIIPVGWLYMEQVNYNRAYDEYVFQGVDTRQQRMDMEQLKTASTGLDSFIFDGSGGLVSFVFEHKIISKVLLPAMSRTRITMAYAQNYTNLAHIACLISVHQQKEKVYPESLNKLIGNQNAYLPHDVLTGEPFHYKRHTDGNYILYSIGWNLSDDGGSSSWNTKRRKLEKSEGDWVWYSRVVNDSEE